MFEITLGVNQSNQRLDKVLSRYLKEAPSGFIYKMLRKKNITLNGEKALGNEKTVSGDTVQFYFSQETYDKMRGPVSEIQKASRDFPEIEVLYEDTEVCIFIKPAGVLSQKAAENDYSVNEWVITHAVERGLVSGSDLETFRPSVCNRLDRNTSGIMAAGLSERGLQILSGFFREGALEKSYYALVKGKITEHRELHGYLHKDELKNKVTITEHRVADSKPIFTEYEPVKVFSDRTLLQVTLHSGKSHQIRAHLASVGHPLLGDPKYGDQNFNLKYGIYNQCLHSFRLSFPDCALSGISGKTFEAPVPKHWPV